MCSRTSRKEDRLRRERRGRHAAYLYVTLQKEIRASVKRVILFCLSCVAMADGCERHRAAAPSTKPGEIVKTASANPATAATQPAVSYMLIDQQPFEFPAAKVI